MGTKGKTRAAAVLALLVAVLILSACSSNDEPVAENTSPIPVYIERGTTPGVATEGGKPVCDMQSNKITLVNEGTVTYDDSAIKSAMTTEKVSIVITGKLPAVSFIVNDTVSGKLPPEVATQSATTVVLDAVADFHEVAQINKVTLCAKGKDEQ